MAKGNKNKKDKGNIKKIKKELRSNNVSKKNINEKTKVEKVKKVQITKDKEKKESKEQIKRITKINKLVLHGFKSFARHTEIIFGDGFNAIIGPNGAGKSNITDALCFVFGRLSAKSLRTEKSANLIYNGGKTKKPAKQAEVSVFLDNHSRVFPVDSDEVKITRIVKQNGQSVYKINDTIRTRQQVEELLSFAKIDPEGYNIILQGDITKFVEMNSEERRRIIEDISGIGIYEERKRKALNELNKVDEKLRDAEIILNERKNRLKELKKDRDYALKYKNTEEMVDSYRASLLQLEMNKIKVKIDNYLKLEDEMNQRLSKLKEDIEKISAKIKEKQEKIDFINKEIEKRSEKEQLSLHNEVEELRVEIARIKANLENYKKELKSIEDRKVQLEKDKQESLGRVSIIENKLKELNERKRESESELKDIVSKLEEFKKKYSLEEAAEIDSKIIEIDNESEKIMQEIQKLREKQQELLREKDRLEFNLNSLEQRIKKIQEIEKENKEQLKKLEDLRKAFKSKSLELNKLLNKDSSDAALLGSLREKLVKMREELMKLEVKNTKIKEGLALDLGLRVINELKNKIEGIYGTISELGRVKAKYSLALEVAAGNKLKMVVVKDDSVASKCIKHLKERKAGVVSFIPLNKIQVPNEKAEINKYANAKGVHGKAINLISFDKRFKKAFEFVFHNTLVVDNIDVARRIGIGKFKMVSLDGDLAEMSGVMRGGYITRGKKTITGFVEQETQEKINELSKEISKLESDIKRLEESRKKNDEIITTLRNEKANLEGEIIKLEKSLHISPEDLDSSVKDKQTILEKIKRCEDELKDINAKITDLNHKLTNFKIEKQKLRNTLSNIRNPRILAELNAFEQKRSELKEIILKLEGDINRLAAERDAIIERDRASFDRLIADIEKNKIRIKEEIKKLESLLKQKEKLLAEKEKEEKKFYVQFKELFNQRSKISDEIQKLEIKKGAKEEEIRNIEIKLNTASVENASYKARYGALQEEFEKYKDKKIKIYKDLSEDELKKKIKSAEKILSDFGNVNLKALEIYDLVLEEFNKLNDKRKALLKEKDQIIKLMEEIESKKKDAFIKTFEIINQYFKRIFVELAPKGVAELVLENPNQPFDAGVAIKVKLGTNKFLDIRALSGGEKTLTALAFIFAIQEFDPAPFYIFDEVEAALDKKNSEELAETIKRYSTKAQYIIITHNDAIISRADNLYGVSMDENSISQVVSLKL